MKIKKKKYGRLTILDNESPVSEKVRCKCECGKTVRIVYGSLRRGNTKSCGCLRKELFMQRITKHEKRHTTEYNAWRSMKTRCYNVNAPGYLGETIAVCRAWRANFAQFMDDMGKKPDSKAVLTRKNEKRNFSPSNCFWSKRKGRLPVCDRSLSN